MATLTLTKVFINHVETGDWVAAQASRDRNHNIGVASEVRTYGGGRRRAITQTGTTEVIDVTLRLVPAADKAKLESWLGQQVLYRDDRGRRLPGVFSSLSYKEYVDQKTVYDVALSITGVTWQEGE